MKRTIPKHLIIGFPKKENVKEYLIAIGERSQVSDNAESGCLMKQFYSKNNKTSNGSKHLELKYLTVRYLVKKNDILVEYIGTDFMLVDPLPKGLRPIVFKNHVESMDMVSSFDVLG